MSSMRQVVLGVSAALFSAFIIFGSMLLALSEGGRFLALALTPTVTFTALPPVDTPLPGEPTFTPTPTPLPSATPTLPASADCPIPDGWQTMVIMPGDKLRDIAAAYSLTLEEMLTKNCINSEVLIPNNYLYVPAFTHTPTLTPQPPTSTPSPTRPTATRRPTRTCTPRADWSIYIVKRGDTLYAISTAYGITVQQLQAASCITTILIHPGDVLRVPNVATRTPIPSRTPRPTNTPRPTDTVPPTTIVPPTTPAPTTPSDTPVPPSDTPVPPSDTPVPPSITPTDPPTSTPVPPTLAPPSPSATPDVDM